jgi:hypothetical protein
MRIKFIKDFNYKGILFEADTTYTISNEMFAKYVIRKGVAIVV